MDTKQLYRAKPFFPEEDKKEIKSKWEEILDTGMFIQGKHVAKLEEEFASYCDTKYAIATNSGATALEVALRATGIENKKFIVPTQTFIASVSAIIRSNNIPVITDINPETQCLDLEIIKQNIDDQTAGIMWVHMAGLISPDYLEIKKYCDKKGLIILEDASHAVGSSMKGHKAGNLGLAGCFSLFATKIITSGEGGMITTNDEKFAKECRILRNHGSVRNDGNVKGLDYGVNCTYASSNYRMVETSAVVGLTQLRRVDEFVHKRNLIADRYKAKLSSKLFLPPVNEDTKMTWWQYIIILPKSFSRQDRENFAKELLEKYKIPTANAYWPACHDQPAFKFYVNPDQQYKNANDILDRHLSLPMYFEMELEQVDYISKSINELL
jgi:perosamine synthetase